VWFPTDVDGEAAGEVGSLLDRVGVEIEPRKLWPTGADSLGVPVRGKLRPEEQLQPGRALARLTDLGWGGRLRELLADGAADQEVPRAVLEACVRVLADWDWDARPGAVAAMPSRRRPIFIESLARGLASIGRLPFAGTLAWRGGPPSGEPGGNSAFRLASVWGRFSADALDLPRGVPVLLVDDLVDSRWTVTIAGQELLRAGASAVLPFAAAVRS
jgi:ATP-dependent DNA helicase RecQ